MSQAGVWSFRRFGEHRDALRFAGRLPDDNPPPLQLDEPCQAPDGSPIAAGTWIVLYQPIIDDCGWGQA
jgi:hypothetical protein